jgi:hypothetical protein
MENALDSETHIHSAHPKRKGNGPPEGKEMLGSYDVSVRIWLRHWQCRASGDSDILCTKRQQSGKDSVIEGQPLLLFM